jgi:hypothetical protein
MGTTERQHQCKACGKAFSGRKRKFCNDPCNRTMYSLTCEVCQKSFQAVSPNRKVCGTECTAISNRTLSDCKCKWCGESFRKAHGSRRKGLYCSREHAFRSWRLVSVFHNLQDRFTKAIRKQQRAEQVNQRTETREAIRRASLRDRCKTCGDPITPQPWASRCEKCKDMAKRIQRRVHHRNRRRKERKAGQLNRFSIYVRDNWTCGFCGKKVDRTKKAPHPQSPTIDHIVPLAKGGTNEPTNLQCAHWFCNVSAGATGGKQKRLL